MCGNQTTDFNAEIHLVQASHHTEGKPRSVAVKWLVYSHNHVITELSKQHTLLFPVQIISILHCTWRPWWRRGVKWWCYDRCITLQHCLLLLMKAVSLKEIVFHSIVWCYLLALDLRQLVGALKRLLRGGKSCSSMLVLILCQNPGS